MLDFYKENLGSKGKSMSMPVIKFDFCDKTKRNLSIFMFIGFVTFISGLFLDSQRVWFSFLVSSLFVLFLSLGGLFFTSIQHVSKAGWSVNIRRIMEGFGAYIPIGCIAALFLVLSGDQLYVWFNSSEVAKDSLLVHKSSYLNPIFFIVRLLVFSAIWIVFYKLLTQLSLNQDKTGDESLTSKSVSYSIAFLALFTLSFTFFTVDTLMSLEPHWFSTVFGVYAFAGLFQSFLAALILFIIYFRRKGYLKKELVNANHLHDLGKFLFGFTIFWAYIAFSQYMLVWYANLPEEAVYYLHRSQYDWLWVSLALIVFKFIVPFIYLLPRWVKRDESSLIVVSVLILVMQYVDIYWMVYPNYDSKDIHFGFIEVGVFIGFIGLFLYTLLRFFSLHPMVALKDPRQKESLDHHVTY